MLEVDQKQENLFSPRIGLLDRSPAPVVWTFCEGIHTDRMSLRMSIGEGGLHLVGLVSADAGLGFKGVVEAETLFGMLGRTPGEMLPSDVFVFSINTEKT